MPGNTAIRAERPTPCLQERIYITDENDERHCHISASSLKVARKKITMSSSGQPVTWKTQEAGAVTSVLPV